MIKKIKHLPKSFKIGLFILVLISGAYVSSRAFGYGQNNNSDGLVLDMTLSSGYYNTGTKTFSDQSGNNNHGVSANNAVFVPDKDGKSEGAMRFNGSSDYVSNSESSLNARTMSLWFYSNSNSEQVIAGGFLGPTYYALVYINNKLSIAGSGGANAKVITQNTYPINTWHHVVVLRTSQSFPNEFRIFVNGVEQSLEVGGSHRVCYGSRIGARYYSNTFSVFFDGRIENFRAWDRELSVLEIQDLYKQEYVPKIQASSLEKGLVGYWPLDGEHYNSNTNRVTDKSAYSNHGTNYGATLTADRFGRSEGAMNFEGGNYYILLGNKSSLGLGNSAITVSHWIYFSNNTGYKSLFFAGATGGGKGYGTALYDNRFRYEVYGDAGGRQSTNVDIGLINDAWNHVVAVFDTINLEKKVFLNGVQRHQKTLIDPVFVPTAQTNLGSHGLSTWYYNGLMDEVRVYNRALSDTEIKSLYERDAPKISASSLQKGLILDMPLTSQYTKGGGVILDKSAYSNHGQNYGASITNEGAVFNASSYIQINNPINQSNLNQEWTVSAWVNIGNTGSSQLLISGLNHGLSLTHATTNRALLYLNSGDNDYYVYSNAVNLLANQGWKHVVFTFRNSDGYRKIYINGEDKTGSGPNKTSTPSGLLSLFRIGHLAQGTISGVRIYNRVLSLSEIKSLYDQGRSQTGVILGGN